MIYLVNPKHKRKGARVAKRRRKLHGAAATAHAKKLAKTKRRRHRRTTPRGAKKMAKRRSTRRRASARRRVVHRNPPKRKRAYHRRRAVSKRRSFRRSARKMSRALVPMVTQGFKDAAGVVVGKAAARAIPQMVGLAQAGYVGMAIQAVAAVAAGWAANRFIGANFGRMVLAGGLSAPLESLVKSLNIPIISAGLSDDYLPGIGSYPMLAAYPQELSGYAGDEDVAMMSSVM